MSTRRWPARTGALVAGAVPALAYPGVSWWWLAWFAWVPLLLIVRAAPGRREGVVRAWFGVVGFQCAVQYWLAPDVGPALLLFAAILAVLWLPWGWAVHRFMSGIHAGAPRAGRMIAAALVVVPSAWLCGEGARSWQSLGGPWALLGATQWNQTAMLASASLGGVWLTGFLIAVCNVALACAAVLVADLGVGPRWMRGLIAGPSSIRSGLNADGQAASAEGRTAADGSGAGRVHPAGALAALACVAAAGLAVGPVWSALRSSPDVVRTARVAIVQPGVEPTADGRLLEEEALTAALADQRPELVVWGEASVSGDPAGVRELPALAADLRADILVVGDLPKPGSSGTYNTSVLIGPGGVIAEYRKIRLVPFGEYIPLRPVLGWVTSVSKAARVNRERGDATVVMNTGSLAFGPLICFESAFPDMARKEVRDGAQLLVFQTSTSTFQGSWAQPQHASLAAVRAAETGRPALHAGLTGVSAGFDGRGHRLAWRTSGFRGAVVVDIPLTGGMTPYDRSGDWMLVIAFAVTGSAVLVEVVRARCV